MIENTATYDFLIENENHPRIAWENAIRGRAQGCFRQSLHALNARERKWTYPSEGGARRDAEENLGRLIPQAGQSPKLD